MPPAKRKADKQAEEAEPNTAPAARLTRSTAKRAAASSGPPSVAELPEKKTVKAKGKRKKKEEPQKEGEGVLAEADKGEVKAEGDSSRKVLDASKKTIVIEHCKQCNSFKTRANLVKEGLEKGTSGITVILNPEKPRRGCFEIREEEGKKFISLLDMKRPFKPMKDLDMDKVISDIIDEISSSG